MEVNFTLSEDQTTLTLSFANQSVTLDALGVDALLERLGEFRGAMLPAVPSDYPLGQVVQAIADPAWRTEPDALAGNTIIHMRDPRFGWLHYLIPRNEAAKLAALIQAQVDAPQSAPKPGQVN